MNYVVGQNLRKLRLERNISENAMAEYCGVEVRKLLLMEEGIADISYPIIKKAADLLGVSLEDFSKEEEESLINLFIQEGINDKDIIEKIGVIEEILRTFGAHEKFYFRKRMAIDVENYL
jgi:transcriptional regulator with XRE-family HTH domain